MDESCQFHEWRALSDRVLTVAVVTKFPPGHVIKGDWAAYIDAVIGENFDREWELVYQHGDKLPYEIAKYLYPHLAKQYRWRE